MYKLASTVVAITLTSTLSSGFVAAPSAQAAIQAEAHARPGEAPESTFVGELARGDALFWDGPYLASAGTGTRRSDHALCEGPTATMHGCGNGTLYLQPTAIVADFTTVVLEEENPFCGDEHACFTYAFDVTEPGDVLRVALDQRSLRDSMFVYLYDPSGTFATKLTKFNAEVWIDDPPPGRWVARAEVFDARDTSFRMRAALDPDDRRRAEARARPRRAPSRALLPNLQVVPPHELGFGPCQATEIADYGVQRCLRFSTGPANGEGPLDLVITDTGSHEGQMFQRLHHADGSTETAAAGRYEYHTEHVHYHHGALQSLELLRVVDSRRGLLEPAGAGPKLGFCLGPYFIAEWHTFGQDPPYAIYDDDACTGAGAAPVATQMALARGWVDIYSWWIEGNFVDFGDNPDGLYVIRAASDPDGDIRETRDDDNVAYTYLRVTGDKIDVLERGRGDHPWDAHKVVVHDNRRATRWTE